MTTPRPLPRSSGAAAVPGSGPQPRVRLSGPGAVVACLPQLIGFHPQESLVLVGLVPGSQGRGKGRPQGKRQLGLTLRIDLDDVIDSLEAAAIDAHYADAEPEIPTSHPSHPERLVDALVRNDCVGALVVLVTDRVTTPPDRDAYSEATEVVDALDVALYTAGIDLSDVVLVTQGRWWSYLCTNPACCPLEGTAISQADSDLYTAELAWNGESAPVLPSRSAVEAKVAPAASDVAQSVHEAATRLRGEGARPAAESLSRIADLLKRFRSADREVAPDLWARVLVDLTDVQIRDGCLPTWKGKVGEAGLDLWCAATRIAPPGLVAAPATLVALLAHARGEGALASCALTRAVTDDPDYRMARYAGQCLGGGVPPTVMRRMLVETKASMRSQGMPVLDRRGRLAGDGRSDDSVTPGSSAGGPAASGASMEG